MEILNGLYKSKDGLTWNETTDLLNKLIAKVRNETRDKIYKRRKNTTHEQQAK